MPTQIVLGNCRKIFFNKNFKMSNSSLIRMSKIWHKLTLKEIVHLRSYLVRGKTWLNSNYLSRLCHKLTLPPLSRIVDKGGNFLWALSTN